MKVFNDLKMKERDTLNRRQVERQATSFHDMFHARYFTIDNSIQRYEIRQRGFQHDEYSLWTAGDDIECVGFLKPMGKVVKVFVNRHGIHWEAKIKLSKVKCYGTN